MMALRLVMLMVAVALIYAMFMKTQTKTEELPPDLVQSSPAAVGHHAPQTTHDQYKEAMDRAHAAADAMKAQHKEDADSF